MILIMTKFLDPFPLPEIIEKWKKLIQEKIFYK